MICDSVEAASRSLKHISEQSLRDLITSVVERQRQDGQFDEAEISYRQINRLKEILTEKLLEIYHSPHRVPEGLMGQGRAGKQKGRSHWLRPFAAPHA